MLNRVTVMIWFAAATAVAAAAAGCGPVKPPPTVSEPSEAPGWLVIEPPMARYVSDLDPREQQEQLRDWAVFGTVTHLGGSADAAAAATYELPPGRLPYLDALYSFEHGSGRRVYLDGRVLLFRDADDPDPQATIGRLADRVRMESGEVPGTLEVYAVHGAQSDGNIRVQRLPDVARDDLFSPAYGYVEGTASDAVSLAAWLESADDLTFAQLTEDGRLVLGGRRFAGTRTQNLTAEDIAALYQAHDEMEQPRARAQKWLAKRPMQTRVAIEQVIDLLKHGKSYEAWSELSSVRVPMGEEGIARDAVQALAHEAAPGFSLDPEWLPEPGYPGAPAMLARLRAFSANPCAELQQIARRADVLEQEEPDEVRRSSRTAAALRLRQLLSESGPLPAAACRQIQREVGPSLAWLTALMTRLAPADWKIAQAAYQRLSQKLVAASASRKQDPDVLALSLAALDFYDQDSSVQCGTYFGTRGTRVGMTLFYTDLLAKLWGSDYGHSAPTPDVPGFLATPFINLPSDFADELRERSSTRFWFGPRADGVSRAGTEGTAALLFDHRFTRIYAAGHDPGQPGIETQPAENERRSISWWDRHFDEVADFEQEYHRQNQIMKWAVVTASLTDSPAGEFLKQVRVDRSLDFHAWYAGARGQLRFSDPLPAAPASIAGKECLPLISSYPFENAGAIHTFAGGVATVARGVPARVPQIRVQQALGTRRPHVADLGAGQVGTAQRALPTRAGKDVTFFNAASAPTRSAAGNAPLGRPTVSYQGTSAAKLEIHAGKAEQSIGALQLEARSASRVQMGWRDGAVELARRDVSMPASLAGADKLAASGRLADAAQVYQRLGSATVARTADDLARQVVVETARRRPAPVLQTLQKLESKGAKLAPEARSAVEHAVSEVGTKAAAKHVSLSLRTGKPLTSAEGRLIVNRGRIIVTRDIDQLPAAVQRNVSKTQLSRAEVYIDSRLRVGREGFVPDTGGSISRWANRPGVTVEALDRNAIGALSDQIVVRASKLTLERVAVATATATPPLVFIIRKASDTKDDESKDRGACKEAGPSGGSSDPCARQR